MGQYQQALLGIYNDHHPAMMSFAWRYFDKICPGYGSMYLLQIGLFYLGLYFIWQAAETFLDFKKSPALLLFIFFLPWWPQVLLFSIQIQKDNGFTFSFFAIAAALANYSLRDKQISLPAALLIFVGLIYGTAVKYQAQFILPILSIWFGWLLVKSRPPLQRLTVSIFTTLAVYASVVGINAVLVPKAQQSNSWQYVKLFDLAAISKSMDQDLILDINKTPHFSFEKLKNQFQENVVDPYVFPADAILKKNTDPLEQQQLWDHWFSVVRCHPFYYLKHRWMNFSHCLIDRVGYTHVDRLLPQIIDPETKAFSIVKGIIDLMGYAFVSQFLVILLGVIYFVASVVYWRRSKLAPIIFCFTSMALLFIGILLFMSMAGTPRYTYFSLVMIHGCHLFAIGLFKSVRKQNEEVFSEY
ncbi:hypothetical protein [Candidatus Odyssella acanthamoebae]|nr:hypothetical protein [Candidatus Paracaedibacter acanthamoebae]